MSKIRIGYSKTGRAWNINAEKWSTLGGDVDVWRTLHRLARAWPEHEFVLVGRNSGEKPSDVGLPSNVTNPWADGLSDAIREVGRGRKSPMTVEDRFRIVKGTHALTGPLFQECDAHIVWAGQQGTSNLPIPKLKQDGGGGHAPVMSDLTNTQDAFILYGSYIDLGLNAWRWPDPVNREEVWLLPDPRNYLKSRSVAWPLLQPVMGQFNQRREWKHERYQEDRDVHPAFKKVVKKVEDGHIWVAETDYEYQGVEFTALPDPIEWVEPLQRSHERQPFGLLVNENRPYVANSRAKAISEWVLPWYPQVPIVGTWTAATKKDLGIDPTPVPYAEVFDRLTSWRSTFTMPASGSGWATAKPWECFLAGTICFFHPAYDTQGHIVPTLKQLQRRDKLPAAWQSDDRYRLAQWLRPPNPDALLKAARAVALDDDIYIWLAVEQFDYLTERWNELQCMTELERRLGLRRASG